MDHAAQPTDVPEAELPANMGPHLARGTAPAVAADSAPASLATSRAGGKLAAALA